MSTAHNAKVTFLVSVDEIDGGYSASPLEYGIHTQAESLDELRPQHQRSRGMSLRPWAGPTKNSIRFWHSI